MFITVRCGNKTFIQITVEIHATRIKTTTNGAGSFFFCFRRREHFQKVRRILKNKTEEILSDYDFILSPTSPHTPFDLGKQIDDPIKMYLEDIYTVHANLTGLPSISLPLNNHSNGLPSVSYTHLTLPTIYSV